MIKRMWVIGDLHAGVHSNSNDWFQNMAFYFDKVLIPLLQKHSKDGDIIIFTGDINDHNQVIRTEISNYLLDAFTRLAEILPVRIIVGNHDIVKKYTNDVNSVRPLGMIQGVEVITEPKTEVLSNGEEIFYMPWCHSTEDEKANIEGTNAQYMVSHAHYMGMGFGDEYVYKAKDGTIISTPLSLLDKFKRVWNGHIHKPEVFGNSDHIRNVGIPYPMKWNDCNYQCGITLYDSDTGVEKFLRNKFSPGFIYYNLLSFLEMDIDEINEEVRNNYVKVMYPSDIRNLLDLEVIYEHLSGYRSIEFVPTTEKIGEQNVFKQMKEFSTDKNLDVESVIPSYVDSLMIDDETKDRLKLDLGNLYKESQNLKTDVVHED